MSRPNHLLLQGKVKEDLIRQEGMRLKPYLCSQGRLTIGVGRNLDDRGLSEEEAMFLLDNDILAAQRDLQNHLTFYERLPEKAQEVLINMCFNLGIQKLMGFKLTLRHMELGQWEAAAKEMLNSKWAGQVGIRAQELAAQIGSLSQYQVDVLDTLTNIHHMIERLEERLK